MLPARPCNPRPFHKSEPTCARSGRCPARCPERGGRAARGPPVRRPSGKTAVGGGGRKVWVRGPGGVKIMGRSRPLGRQKEGMHRPSLWQPAHAQEQARHAAPTPTPPLAPSRELQGTGQGAHTQGSLNGERQARGVCPRGTRDVAAGRDPAGLEGAAPAQAPSNRCDPAHQACRQAPRRRGGTGPGSPPVPGGPGCLPSPAGRLQGRGQEGQQAAQRSAARGNRRVSAGLQSPRGGMGGACQM